MPEDITMGEQTGADVATEDFSFEDDIDTGASDADEGGGSTAAATPRPASQPAAPDFDRDLLGRASAWGLSEQDARLFQQDRLRSILDSMEHNARTAFQTALANQQRQLAAQYQQYIAQLQQQLPAPKGFEKFSLDKRFAGNKEDWGDLPEYMQPLVDHYNAQVEALYNRFSSLEQMAQQFGPMQQQLQSVLGHSASQVGHQFEGWFHDQIGRLDPAYQQFIGNGDVNKLDPNGPEMTLRRSIASDIEQQWMAAIRDGRRITSSDWNNWFKRSLAANLSDKLDHIVGLKAKQSLQPRRNQALHKPAKVQATENLSDKAREHKAVERVNAALRARGLEPEDEYEDFEP